MIQRDLVWELHKRVLYYVACESYYMPQKDIYHRPLKEELMCVPPSVRSTHHIAHHIRLFTYKPL